MHLRGGILFRNALLLAVVLCIISAANACAPAARQNESTPQTTLPISATRLSPSVASVTDTSTPMRTATRQPIVASTDATPPTPTLKTNVVSTLTHPPAFTPTQWTCWRAGGRVLTGNLDTPLLRLPLQFRVYLPPCYEELEERRFPVLYLFHGQSSSDDQWDRIGADETADRLIAKGEIPPLIIVMPYDRYGGQPIETKFSQAITETLLPYIDKTYRTLPDRAHRAVGGLSRGAGWAVHFAISEWQLFGRLGAHSPAVFHSDAQRMRTWLGNIPADEYPLIYMDIGDRDRPEILRSALWFEALLNEYDIPHEWHLFSGYHSEEYWKTHLEQYLRWYTQDWQIDQ